MPQYKLYYFNSEGRAELIRYLFALGGVEFEDIRYSASEWPQHKEKFPTGQLPVLEVDGHMFAQSVAIARYVAKEFNFYGADHKEQAEVDCVVDTVEDLFKHLGLVYFEKDETRKAEAEKKLNDETIPSMMKVFEKLLARNQAGSDYFVGKSLTMADVAFARGIEMVEKMKLSTHLEQYPKLDKVFKNVITNPKIAAWIAKREQIDRVCVDTE